MTSVASISAARYKGVYPVVPTTFTEGGELDLPRNFIRLEPARPPEWPRHV